MSGSHRDRILSSAGQDFHDLFLTDAPDLAAIRAYLSEMKTQLFAVSFATTSQLERLYTAQQRVAATCRDTLQEIVTLLSVVLPAGSKLDIIRNRVLRGSASGLQNVLEVALDAAHRTERGRAFVRVNQSADKLLAGAGSIEKEIESRGEAADSAWVAQMRELIKQKRDAAENVSDVEQYRAAFLETEEYKRFERLSELVASVDRVEPLSELLKTSMALLNNGRDGSVSGSKFEERMAQSVRDVVAMCGFDAAWFDECERRNEPLAVARTSSTSAPWVDQSLTPHSLRCKELAVPNLRVAFNLGVFVPEIRDGVDALASVGEVDALVFDAVSNEVLIWIEAKAHAPDLPKADSQATGLLHKVFARRAVVCAERSKVPWFRTEHFARFREPAARARNCVIVSRVVDPQWPLRVPSFLTTAIQKLVWSVDDDEQLLDGIAGVRASVEKLGHRTPRQIVEFYEQFDALDRICLLAPDT